VPHFVEALYLQLTPIQPVTDSLSKLEQVTTIYRHAASRGFKVIAGHAGAATPALRAFGIDAADAGLATWSPRTRVLRTDRAIP
jgi:dihydrodipicolinate synthase/N-acetylneuraminate lyase